MGRGRFAGPVIFQASFSFGVWKLFFRTLSLWSVNRYRPDKNCQYAAHFAISLCAFYMLNSRWVRSHYFHTPNTNAAWKMTGPANLPGPRSSVSVVSQESDRTASPIEREDSFTVNFQRVNSPNELIFTGKNHILPGVRNFFWVKESGGGGNANIQSQLRNGQQFQSENPAYFASSSLSSESSSTPNLGKK